MRKLYLYGDLAENFAGLAKPFIESAGGENSRIVLLIAGGNDWKKHIESYLKPFRINGAKDISVIVPEEDGLTISDENHKKIKAATGIFVGGGLTASYQKIYCNPKVAKILIESYNKGIPYAGLSAGAIIVASSFWEYEHSECVLEGLAILENSYIVPHFIESNGFRVVVQQIDNTKNKYGIGIDNCNCVEIINEEQCRVIGPSNCYLFEMRDDKIEFKIYENGNEFCI
jgi:cyanophycinase